MKCATTGTSTPVLVGEEVLVAAWNKMGGTLPSTGVSIVR